MTRDRVQAYWEVELKIRAKCPKCLLIDENLMDAHCERCGHMFYVDAPPPGSIEKSLRQILERTMSKPNRFDYVKYDQAAADQQNVFKIAFQAIEEIVGARLKPGRAQSLVLTKLEEAYMWIGKAIRDEQIERNGSAPLQEERTNS